MTVAYEETDLSGDRVPDRVEGVHALRGEASFQYRFHPREAVEPDTEQPACGSERIIQVRWPHALLTDDLVCRGDLLLEELSWGEDGWQQRWGAL